MDKHEVDRKTYFKLFTSTFYLSAFTFGGGYVIVPLMRKTFVEDLKWIEEKEMLNLIAIAQSSPGAAAVNVAILLGYNIAGPLGAAITILGTILPPLIILTIISLFYASFKENRIVNSVLRGMQSGVAAVIVDVVIKLGGNVFKQKEALSIIIMFAAFILTFIFEINIIYIILASALIGAAKIILWQKSRKAGSIK
jgi:chromate transporter